MASKKDVIWHALYKEVQTMAADEPILASYLHSIVLNHGSLDDSLSFHLASKLSSPSLQAMQIRDVIDSALLNQPRIGDQFRADLQAICDRDPAACGVAEPFLYYKGFHALESYRVGHWLWENG
ncbi:MAG: serine O-acetyltransferase, partial [bacterium]|nr:serine O-acetyltransferase [bacterium]